MHSGLVLKLSDHDGDLILAELLNFYNSRLFAKLRWHDMHRLIAAGEFVDQPAGMCAGPTAPVQVSQKMCAVSIDRMAARTPAYRRRRLPSQ